MPAPETQKTRPKEGPSRGEMLRKLRALIAATCRNVVMGLPSSSAQRVDDIEPERAPGGGHGACEREQSGDRNSRDDDTRLERQRSDPHRIACGRKAYD